MTGDETSRAIKENRVKLLVCPGDVLGRFLINGEAYECCSKYPDGGWPLDAVALDYTLEYNMIKLRICHMTFPPIEETSELTRSFINIHPVSKRDMVTRAAEWYVDMHTPAPE